MFNWKTSGKYETRIIWITINNGQVSKLLFRFYVWHNDCLPTKTVILLYLLLTQYSDNRKRCGLLSLPEASLIGWAVVTWRSVRAPRGRWPSTVSIANFPDNLKHHPAKCQILLCQDSKPPLCSLSPQHPPPYHQFEDVFEQQASSSPPQEKSSSAASFYMAAPTSRLG